MKHRLVSSSRTISVTLETDPDPEKMIRAERRTRTRQAKSNEGDPGERRRLSERKARRKSRTSTLEIQPTKTDGANPSHSPAHEKR